MSISALQRIKAIVDKPYTRERTTLVPLVREAHATLLEAGKLVQLLGSYCSQAYAENAKYRKVLEQIASLDEAGGRYAPMLASAAMTPKLPAMPEPNPSIPVPDETAEGLRAKVRKRLEAAGIPGCS